MLKGLLMMVLVLCSTLGVTQQISAAITAAAQDKSPSEIAFDRLKGLVGTWDVVEKFSSKKFTARYTMTGGGSVLMEDLSGMTTAYHLDKDTLLLTHYCGVGNQPRMRVKTVANNGRQISFEMYDITNLKNPDAYRSTSLEVQFHDAGTADLSYGGWSAARGAQKQTFHLLRRTSAPKP